MPFVDLNSHHIANRVRHWSKRENQRIKEVRRLAILRVVQLRLEESRTLADMMDTDYARKQMLMIAASYDRLAEHSLKRGMDR
jgi:hypothetical protein